ETSDTCKSPSGAPTSCVAGGAVVEIATASNGCDSGTTTSIFDACTGSNTAQNSTLLPPSMCANQRPPSFQSEIGPPMKWPAASFNGKCLRPLSTTVTFDRWIAGADGDARLVVFLKRTPT